MKMVEGINAGKENLTALFANPCQDMDQPPLMGLIYKCQCSFILLTAQNNPYIHIETSKVNPHALHARRHVQSII
jgi:hypothetical protein